MALQTPSPTLYVSNLEAKTKKPELRAQLYALFNPYGHILDIVAKKNGGMRGQAFVVFEEQTAATAAMRGVTGKTFYGKLLSITYAKKPSNATLARSDPSASREAAAIQAAKLTVSRAQNEYEQLEKEREETDTAAMGGNAKRDLEDAEGGEPGAKRAKKEQGDDDEMEIEMDEEDDDAPAGTSLICTNLPPECSEEIMGALFSQHTGFSKATLLPSSATLPSSLPSPNPGAKAFRVTFASASQAKAAVEATSGFLMQPGWSMGVAVE